MRDTSLRLPPGDYGTVVEVRVFNRHGVDKDERALQIEREEVERLSAATATTSSPSSSATSTRACKDLILGKTAVKGPKGIKAGSTIDEELLGTLSRGQWWQLALGDDADAAGAGGAARPVRAAEEGARAPLRGQGREGPPRRRPAAGRDEDGQGLHRGEAQAAARRQDGRPPRQQGRDLQGGAAGGHAVPRRRHAGRLRAEPARRAEPDERRPDPRDPHGLGRARPRQGDRRGAAGVPPQGRHDPAQGGDEDRLRRGRLQRGAIASWPRTSSSRSPATSPPACRSRRRSSTAPRRRTSTTRCSARASTPRASRSSSTAARASSSPGRSRSA